MNQRYTLLCLFLMFLLAPLVQAEQRVVTQDQIIVEAETMAATQFEKMNWNFWSRTWQDGTLWVGVIELDKVSDHPDLRKAILKMGNKNTPKVGPWELWYVKKEAQPHHADDFTTAQAFLDAYVHDDEQVMIADTIRRVEAASDVILSDEAADRASRSRELPQKEGLTWYWIDALFMAAPVFAQLSEVTGDPKYLEAMHVEWRRVSDLLYDEQEQLYFRDVSFMDSKTKNGQKVFWSRGIGWVMGAFARTLPFIPEDDPRRGWYVEQFKEMATRLASLQRPDGTWSPSLLDYEEFPYSETSGTGLNTFAMAWGINNGILDEATFRPVVEKAWAAMLAARNDEVFLGYVQGVGAKPAATHTQMMTWYGNGSFLMAAAQLSQMAPLTLPPAPELSSEANWPSWHKNSKAWQAKEAAKKAAQENTPQ